jgi:hypothetical protein
MSRDEAAGQGRATPKPGLTCNMKGTFSMSQATERPTTSRRALLAAMPAAAVVTVAWGRESALSEPAGDDAELLALKAKFDPLFAVWVALKIAEREEHEQFVLIYQRETGLSFDDRPAINWDDPAWVACQEAMKGCHQMLRKEDKKSPAWDWDNLQAELDPLADDILSYNASTLDGLRLQLRALISAYDETWAPAGFDQDEDPEQPWMRNFIESAAGILSVPFPPY